MGYSVPRKIESLLGTLCPIEHSRSLSNPYVAQAHHERSAYISLFFFAYIMSRQNISAQQALRTKISRVWVVYLTHYMQNLKVAREAWSKRPITFTVKSLKKILLIIPEKKFKITYVLHIVTFRISTFNTIRG